MEGEGADEVAVAEEVHGIETFLDCVVLLQGAVAGACIGFAAVLYLPGERIRNLAALEGKKFVFTLAEKDPFRRDDAGIEVLQTRRTSDIFRNDEIKLQFANAACHLRLSVVLIERREDTRSHLKHRRTRHSFSQLRVSRRELGVLFLDLSVLRAVLLIFFRQTGVGGV